MQSHHLGGGAVGAVVGAAVGLVVVLVVDRLAAGDQNDLFWLPVGIVTGVFAGGMMGLLLAEILVGGREDERETDEARAALARERALRQKDRPTSDV
jgi:hypothetical protein